MLARPRQELPAANAIAVRFQDGGKYGFVPTTRIEIMRSRNPVHEMVLEDGLISLDHSGRRSLAASFVLEAGLVCSVDRGSSSFSRLAARWQSSGCWLCGRHDQAV